MKKILSLLFLLALHFSLSMAQSTRSNNSYNQINENGDISRRNGRNNTDSLGSDKEIPKGIYVWTVDERFGDRTPAPLDTMSHMFPNTVFATGLRGEYNTTGNLGSARQARIFIDRRNVGQFIFTQPYDYFVKPVSEFHFTNTLSPFTNLTYNNCGNRTNGEDHFTAKFGINAGKKIGVGFNFDYLYARGYYDSQAASHFNYTMYGSYLGERYQAHLLASTNYEKVTENGGITNDDYITHPEAFTDNYAENEIPTMLTQNWNRNDNQHVFFSQRYSIGFNRKVPMTAEEIKAKKFAMESKKEEQEQKDKAKLEKEAAKRGAKLSEKELKNKKKFTGRPDDAKIAEGPVKTDSIDKGGRINVSSKAVADSLIAAEKKTKADTSWLKNEYVPVTSFIHTIAFDNYRRIYEAYQTPANYYLDKYTVAEKLTGDSIYDKTQSWTLRNTFAISLLEGFNKWVKTGAKIFAEHELRHFTLPDSAGVSSWNENALSVGAQLSKTQGKTLHYNVTGMLGVAGINAGEIHVNGGVDLNFPLFKDTMTLAASGFYAHEKPSFYYRHYQSRHYWWDDEDMSMVDHLHLQGLLNYQKTRTQLRFAFDELHNYTYFSTGYTTENDQRLYNKVSVKQAGSPISVFTAEARQNLTFGLLNWETVATVQKSTDEDALPLPLLNVYTNLYLKFKIAHVLKCDLGGDLRYFTGYNAPEYVPGIGQYGVQDNDSKVKVGNCPIINVYANFHLQHTRFFVMMSHVNASMGKKNYFFAPHYPLNGSVLRFGISWNFFN